MNEASAGTRGGAATGTSQPLRIMHVVAPAPFGGLERVVVGLAAGHHARGNQVLVVALMGMVGEAPPMVAELAGRGVPTRVLRAPGRAYRRKVRDLRSAAAEFAPDIIHSHDYLPDVLTALVVRRHAAPVVSTVHGFTGGSLRNHLYQWLQVRAYRWFDAVVAVSPGVRDRLLAAGTPASRLRVVQNAFSGTHAPLGREGARARLGMDAEGIWLGWVGRVSHEKGLDVLVRALPALADLPVRVAVIGDGPERRHVEATARTLGVEDRLTWLGVVADAGSLMPAFDALVLSSRTEGTPITLLEAMHAGVPVIAAAVGGIPAVVSAEEALLVPSNDPRALASAIRELVARPTDAAARARRAGQRLASSFSLDPWLSAYEEVYVQIRSAFRSR